MLDTTPSEARIAATGAVALQEALDVMDEALAAPVGRAHVRVDDRRRASGDTPIFAALDLGTNNCRLLIAARTSSGFRIIDAFSRIVRLGEGLSMSGRLSEVAMARAIRRSAHLRRQDRPTPRLADQRRRHPGLAAPPPTDQDSRFEVQQKTGLRLAIISPREEAQLSVAGCLNLLDRGARAALVVDVGDAAPLEMSWIDLAAPGLDGGARRVAHWRLPIKAWLSIPIGVVTLAERFPEEADDKIAWFRSMVEAMKRHIEGFTRAEEFRGVFAAGRAHLVGTSGAITSLAGVHLGLARYDRSRVDGLWMTRAECDAVTRRLGALTVGERAALPCIGPDRADLVMAGAAILAAVQELWPCERVRVADRGLREGLLLSLMASGGQGEGVGSSGPRPSKRGVHVTEPPQRHGAPAHRLETDAGRRRSPASQDGQAAHALLAGLAGTSDQRSLRRPGQGHGLPLARRLPEAGRD